MTGASLIDALDNSRVSVSLGLRKEDYLNYNSMIVMPDELSALMHEYDRALVATLTTFYDCLPYSQTRRVADVKIKMARPQISILAGTTTSHLLKTLPEGAWDQGLMSRTFLIYSSDRVFQEDVFTSTSTFSEELAHDVQNIITLQGQCTVSDSYRDLYNSWRKADCPPKPSHPRLVHYCTRRPAHLLKLSIISSADRGDNLLLDKIDFDKALGWLLEAESHMSGTFVSSSSNDSRAIDEALHFVIKLGTVSEGQLVRFLSERVSINSIDKTMDILRNGRFIISAGVDRYGTQLYKIGAQL